MVARLSSGNNTRYNHNMRVERRHGWQVSVAQAMDIQQRLAGQVSTSGEVITVRYIAGVDISAPKASGVATGAVVVLSYPELRVVETKIASGRLAFPYIPGLLSFRESPLILAACQELTLTPDLILVDGQGIAHPRRMGLASHLGLLLNTPTVGCAKSRLCGGHGEPGSEPGSYAELLDRGEVIGAALRPKSGVKPIYVSIGHKVDLQTAIGWVLKCGCDYRLPEPARLAHLAAGGSLKPEKNTLAFEAGSKGRLF